MLPSIGQKNGPHHGRLIGLTQVKRLAVDASMRR
jgi:hypothetical protein